MPRLSIRSLLIGLFTLMALIVGAEGLLAINKIAAVNVAVIDMATNWLPSIDTVREIQALDPGARLRAVALAGEQPLAGRGRQIPFHRARGLRRAFIAWRGDRHRGASLRAHHAPENYALTA